MTGIKKLKSDLHGEKLLKNYMVIFVLIVILVILICVSFSLGRYGVKPGEILLYFSSLMSGKVSGLSETVTAVITRIRMPRILAAIAVGAALSAAGASYQGIFRNPMVSPDILGASAGSSFGAALGILLSLPGLGIQIMSFIFGISAVMITYLISRLVGKNNNTTLILILAGMVISSMFSSFISIIKYVADPYSKLPEITFWLMGSLSSVTMSDMKMIIIPLIIGITVLILVRWRLNVLSFGDEEAASLGVNTKKLRFIVIICSTMITTSVISISGQIGWVGLVIPHFARMITGPNYRWLMPVSMLIGSCYLLAVDNVARNMFSVEIPLGILTALIGAPFFVYLLLRGKKGWI